MREEILVNHPDRTEAMQMNILVRWKCGYRSWKPNFRIVIRRC